MFSQENTEKMLAINEGINLPKIKSAGVLPTEIFEKIFEFARAMEERENENYTECDCCGKNMSKQEFLLQEQNAVDEYNRENPSWQIMEFEDEVRDDLTYCGLECREKLLGNAEECEECGELCHFDYNMTNFGVFHEYGQHDDYGCICVNCVEEVD